MKTIYLVIVFTLAIWSKASSQIFADSFINYVPLVKYKASIWLKNKNTFYGRMIEIKPSSLVLSQINTKSENNLIYDSIPWAQIQTIKVKRQKFLEGLGIGLIGGGLLGYFIGLGTYQYNYSISELDNKDEKNLKGYKSALIVSIPSGIIGALIGSFILKVKFNINGIKTTQSK